ncbi:MAG TPA: hypothetical protein VLG27_01665 [Candidatus Saccharimonadia bacterium]|nr:hypothetical protein [Candidatus Saccharimonadia bacterium]
MSELLGNGNQDPQIRVRTAIAERAQLQMQWIEATARGIGGEKATIEEVFPLPPDVRDEAPDPDWNEEQEATARALGERLGYAAEQNVPSGTVGGVALVEGGKDWKIRAEVEALVDEDVWAVVISGSPHRKIGNDEKEFRIAECKQRLDKDPDITTEKKQELLDLFTQAQDDVTEYDLAVENALDLVRDGSGSPTVLPYGYSLAEGNPLVYEKTGQFVLYGKDEKGRDVIVMRVDREDYEDEESSKWKYRHQPDPMRRMGIIADILAANDETDTPVVFMTSNAYAERQVDAVRAGLKYGRQFAAAMYGRATLAFVKGEEMLPDARLNQLPGAIRIMYENNKKLLAELAAA